MARISTERSAFVGLIDEPQAADALAGRIRKLVLDGQLSEGDVLPSERALMVDTSLGRATVREALRVLEVEALITPHLGRYGGWTVTRPDGSVISRSVDAFVRGTQIRFGSLLAAREAIEPSCAALAAEHRTDADLEALDRQSAQLRSSVHNLRGYLHGNVQWHLAVVQATHNELLIAIMFALGEAIHAGTDIKDFNPLRVRRAALTAHDGVVEAIRAGDPEAARRRMHRHVHAFRNQATNHTKSHA